MKSFKKLVSLLLCLALTFGLVAVAASGRSNAPVKQTVSASAESAALPDAVQPSAVTETAEEESNALAPLPSEEGVASVTAHSDDAVSESIASAQDVEAAALSIAEKAVALISAQGVDAESTLGSFIKYVSSPTMWLEFLMTLGEPFENVPFPGSWDEFSVAAERVGYNYLNLIAQKALELLCALYPNPDWGNYEDYDSEGFLAGREGYEYTAENGAQWSMGFSSRSLIPDDFESGKYIMGRKLNVVSFAGDAKVLDVLDDQLVRAVAVDDGSGRGITVMAVIDGIGLSLTEVKAIRALLADLAEEKNIASINVSCTHVHSCIDTQGVSAPFLYTLIANGINNEYNLFDVIPFTEDEVNFMSNLHAKTVEAVTEAVNGMKNGKLFYSSVDIDRFLRDKSEPISYEKNAAVLRFEPSDATQGICIVNMACHPTSFSFDNTTLSSDYIYYMEQIFNAAGYDMLFVQGALGAITKNSETVVIPEESASKEHIEMKEFGRTVARFLLDASSTESEELSAVLNVKHEEFEIGCTNYLLMLAVKCKLASNVAYRTGDGANEMILPTEIGYIDFGGRVAFALYPAELYPEIVVGGAFEADDAWSYTSWDYEPMTEMVRDGIDMYSVCFANDAIGYVVTDNDFAFIAHEPDELLSAGKYTASTIVNAYEHLTDNLY